MNLHVIDTGFFKLDGGAMFGVVPKQIWERFNASDDLNLCTWAMRCLLIETGDRLVLIDTGIGDKQDEKFLSHFHLHGEASLISSISKKGFQVEDITDVFLTHLHFDHVGGATSRNETGQIVPTFPNAKYWTNKKHWDWALKPNAREKASFLKENLIPLKESGQLHFTENDSFGEIFEIIHVDGHTESQMLPLISIDKGRKLLFAADLFPSVGHIPIPYIMSYDMQPLKTIVEKEEVLAKALNENWILFFEHDPNIECCNLQETKKGVRSLNHFKLDELL